MSQRIAAMVIGIAALILTFFAFTQQGLVSAGAATLKAPTQVNPIAAQATVSALATQAAVPVSPQEVIQSLVQRKIIPENSGRLDAQSGKVTIGTISNTNLIHYNFFLRQYRDFVMSADISWEAGSQIEQCGFFLRFTENNFYLIGINRAGQVFFDTVYNAKWDKSDQYSNKPLLIQTGTSDTNKLLVVGMGDTFTVFINGQLATTYQDARLTQGKLAVEASTQQGLKGDECTFQNMWFLDLSQHSFTPTLVPMGQPTPITVPSLNSQYTTEKRDLSVNYPSDWKVSELNGSTIIYSKGIKEFGVAQIPLGEMTMNISVVSSQNDSPSDLDATLKFMADLYAGNIRDKTITFSQPEDFSMPGRTVRRSVASYSGSDVEIWVYHDHGAIISTVVRCAPGEGPLCEPTAATIVKTIDYNP